MTARPEDVARNVAEWVRFADEDLSLAEHALGMSQPPFRLVAYHAQQCAEKYLKAFLVQHGVEFPFTHNISALLELGEPLAAWPPTLRDAEILTIFAISARHPGSELIVTESEARNAVALAKRVRDAVRDSPQSGD